MYDDTLTAALHSYEIKVDVEIISDCKCFDETFHSYEQQCRRTYSQAQKYLDFDKSFAILAV